MRPRDRHFATYLFDLDGTLIDSTSLITSAFAHTFRAHRCPEPTNDALRAGFGTPLEAQLTTFAQDPTEMEAMASTYREYHAKHHDRLVRSYPGIREQIATLHARGVKLAIVTSKGREAAILGLRQCGLLEYFDVLVTPADAMACKPDPAPVLAALERLDAAATATVFVGDSTHDIQAGRSAGVTTIVSAPIGFRQHGAARFVTVTTSKSITSPRQSRPDHERHRRGRLPGLVTGWANSCALGFSWTLDCERVLAGGVSR